MTNIIGDKSSFAIEVQILTFAPRLSGKTAIWLGGERIGIFEQENYLYFFFDEIQRIVFSPTQFWDPTFEGLNCKEIFFRINPLVGKPEDFVHSMSQEEFKYYKRTENLKLFLGENYDGWAISAVIHNGTCKFLYFPYWDNHKDNTNFDDIKCCDVLLADVAVCYKMLSDLVPDEYWPQNWKRLNMGTA